MFIAFTENIFWVITFWSY